MPPGSGHRRPINGRVSWFISKDRGEQSSWIIPKPRGRGGDGASIIGRERETAGRSGALCWGRPRIRESQQLRARKGFRNRIQISDFADECQRARKVISFLIWKLVCQVVWSPGLSSTPVSLMWKLEWLSWQTGRASADEKKFVCLTPSVWKGLSDKGLYSPCRTQHGPCHQPWGTDGRGHAFLSVLCYLWLPGGWLHRKQDWSRQWEILKWKRTVCKKLDHGWFQEHGYHQCHGLANDTSGWAPDSLPCCTEYDEKYRVEESEGQSTLYPFMVLSRVQAKDTCRGLITRACVCDPCY